jgi:hydroxymethylpyrimidine pyrophosphatase-like HAD family hydrolase
MIALDLDGTLVRADGSVDPRDAAALRAARRAGVVVVIATGRLVAGALSVARALPIDGPLLCADGRLAACARTGASIDLAALGLTEGAPWAMGLDPRCSKGRALAWAAARAGIPRERVAAVGDWLNDISMLAWAGRSFAMGGVLEEVRAAATDTLTAGSGTGGGVAEAIERWLGVSDGASEEGGSRCAGSVASGR